MQDRDSFAGSGAQARATIVGQAHGWEGTDIDELDRRLVHALQLAPRVPWTALSAILGVDPVTLSRRWQRLAAEGEVYATAVDSRTDGLVFAFIEIDCPPRKADAVVDVLVADPAVTTVERTASGRTLMATVIAETAQGMSDWCVTTTAAIEDVTSLRSLLVSDLVADARSWQLRALTSGEAAAVRAIDSAAPAAAPRLDRQQRQAIIRALGNDFRAPASELAHSLGMPQRKVRAAVSWLIASREVSVRLVVARASTSWPVYVWYFLHAPASQLSAVAGQLRKLPEMRVVATTLGQYNLVFAAWLRSLQEVQRLEVVIEERLPVVDVRDRAVVLRTEKHVGHLLDDSGHATGERVPFVPVPAR
jgi:DNA-binding Lrp family transcriptional regulator